MSVIGVYGFVSAFHFQEAKLQNDLYRHPHKLVNRLFLLYILITRFKGFACIKKKKKK